MKRTVLRVPPKPGGGLLVALLLCTLPFSQATAVTVGIPPTVSLFLSTGHPSIPFYDFRAGFPLVAAVRVNDSSPPLPVDAYVGARLPDGRFASWVRGTGNETTLVTQSTPTPFVKSSLLETNLNLNFRYVFSGTEPPGTYLAYVIVVFPGADPLDYRNWFAVSTVPFGFTP